MVPFMLCYITFRVHSLSSRVWWVEIIWNGFVSSLLDVTSISDVKHKDLSHKLPKDEEVSWLFKLSLFVYVRYIKHSQSQDQMIARFGKAAFFIGNDLRSIVLHK